MGKSIDFFDKGQFVGVDAEIVHIEQTIGDRMILQIVMNRINILGGKYRH